jgi:hypothetical protein
MAHHPGLTVTFGIPEGAVKVPAPKAKPLAPLMSAREALRDALRLMLRNDAVLNNQASTFEATFNDTIGMWVVHRVEDRMYIAQSIHQDFAEKIAAALNHCPELIT